MSVLLLSGGLDSMVLLASEVNKGRVPLCVAFNYRQRHSRELDASERTAAHYGAPWQCHALPSAVFDGSALTCNGGNVPRGLHHTDNGQSVTVVPNRNMVFLSLAAAIAVGHGEKRVLIAAHAGDVSVYPDCRPEFVKAADKAMWLSCRVGVQAPFLALDKRGIVALGRKLGVPFEMSWSCYEGGAEPCGECGACCERDAAMRME